MSVPSQTARKGAAKLTTFVEEFGPEAGRMVELGLSTGQARIFLFLFASTMRLGYQPSYREVGARFGITSPNGVKCHLEALEQKGWIGPSGGDSRAVRFLRCPDGGPFRGFALHPAGHGKQEP